MTSSTRRLGVAVVIAGVAACLPIAGIVTPGHAGQVTVRPFSVGVVSTANGESTIEVIARFTGAAWVNTWVRSADQAEPVTPLDKVPDAWLGKPVPRDWNAWSADGRTRRVRVTGTARGSSCEAPTVLVIASPGGAAPPAHEVAIDNDQTVEGFLATGRSDKEFAAMAPIALTAFQAHAASTVADFRGDANLPLAAVSREAMAGQTATLAYLARPASGTPALYYFETFQPTKKDPSYGIRVAGWIRRGANGQWSTFGVKGDVMTSDSTPIPMITPHGVFRLAGREYFLIGLNGYEGWSTGIFEIGADGPREILITPGGGC